MPDESMKKELINGFIEESKDQLDNIENDILSIEKSSSDINEELVNKVFRAVHSIKGSAGYLKLDKMARLAHKMENVLGMIRNREMIPNTEISNVLLSAFDTLIILINNIGNDDETDISEHVEALNALCSVAHPNKEKNDVPKSVAVSPLPSDKDPDNYLNDEPMRCFIEDSNEHLSEIEIDLLSFEEMKDELDEKLVNKVLRAVHSIKGGAGFMGLTNIRDITHKMENVLVIIQNRKLLPTSKIINNLLLAYDTLKDLMNNVKVSNEMDISKQIESLDKLSETLLPKEEKKLVSRTDGTSMVLDKINNKSLKKPVKKIIEKVVNKSKYTETSLRVPVKLLDSMMTLIGELVLNRNQLLQIQSSYESDSLEIISQRINLFTSDLQEAIMFTRMQPIGIVFNKFPRVVRDLANNFGKKVELTIEGKEVQLDKSIIEDVSDPLTHLVRNSVDHGLESPDVRQKAGKDAKGKIRLSAYHKAGQIIIEISDDGQGINSKKLVATAIDKGMITTTQAKAMSEKEMLNLIFLPGFSTAKKVSEISGRGVGMDVVKTNIGKLGGKIDIISKLDKGTTIRITLPLTLAVISCQIVAAEKERYAIHQSNIEEFLRIPAHQAKDKIEKVGEAEVVRLRGNLLPLVRLKDLLGIENTYIDTWDGKQKSNRRQNIADRRSRIIHLYEETQNGIRQVSFQEIEIQNSETRTNNSRRDSNDRRYHASSAFNIVIVSTGAMKFGLVVDELCDSAEIVIKPLGRHLKHYKEYAGATILGDGRVVLILDVVNLASKVGLTPLEGIPMTTEEANNVNKSIDNNKEKLSFVVFRCAEDEQFAVSQNMVMRLEKIKSTDIEEAGGKKVIQYRGRSLVIFTLNEIAQVKPIVDKKELFVIIFNIAGREFGLLASSLVDIIEMSVEMDDSPLKQPGIMGSLIINKHTTLIIDVFTLVHTLYPDWFSKHKSMKASDEELDTILIAEDSKFFRKQIKVLLEFEGYNVFEAEDGMAAWDLLHQHSDKISLVLTDIEMPNLDGLALTKKIRGDKNYSHLPVISLSTLAGDEDIARGKEAGIDDYQIKLDEEKLLRSINDLLREK